MNVSIVIPVYNEADALAACLEAIAEQTIAPLEVIVVDNNSTDTSAAIAQGFDFVRLVSGPLVSTQLVATLSLVSMLTAFCHTTGSNKFRPFLKIPVWRPFQV
jgi:cellulose synthase/poly-beta-1,6-N-acetylglucosamine synthase-like glycosyltransferase